MHHSTDQAMQDLTTVNNQTKVLQSDLAATVNNQIRVLQSDLAKVNASLGQLPDLKGTVVRFFPFLTVSMDHQSCVACVIRHSQVLLDQAAKLCPGHWLCNPGFRSFTIQVLCILNVMW